MSVIPGTVILDVRVKDDLGAAVAGVQVNIPSAAGAKTISTRLDGVAKGFTVPLNQTISAVVIYSPSGYSHSATPKNFFINRSGEIPLTVTRTTEMPVSGWEPDVPVSGTPGEHAFITSLVAPKTAKKGDEIKIVVTAKNTGNEQCELRAILKNYEGKKIDTNPEERLALFESVQPGASKTFVLSTDEYFFGRWAMPDYDWNLQVELAEIAHGMGNVQKIHHTRKFTVRLEQPDVIVDAPPAADGEWTTPAGAITDDGWVAADDVAQGGTPDAGMLTISAPTLAIAGNVQVTGRAPSAHTRVDIMGVRKYLGFDYLAGDAKVARTISGDDGKYSTAVTLDEFGAVTLYARIERKNKPAGFLDWITQPSEWLAKDSLSAKRTVFVMTYPILLGFMAMLVMVLDKKYNFVGIFKKRGKK